MLSNAGVFRRHAKAERTMLRGAMPTLPTEPTEDFPALPTVSLTGRRWSKGNLVLLPKDAHYYEVK